MSQVQRIVDMSPGIDERNIINRRYADCTALLTDNITSMKIVLPRVGKEGNKGRS